MLSLIGYTLKMSSPKSCDLKEIKRNMAKIHALMCFGSVLFGLVVHFENEVQSLSVLSRTMVFHWI